MRTASWAIGLTSLMWSITMSLHVSPVVPAAICAIAATGFAVANVARGRRKRP